MTSPKSYNIVIPRRTFSYGFELKDEGGLYKKYAIVSKVASDVANKQGLKVGDKIIAINGDNVAGKDYVALRNNMRKSENHCVKLEILNPRNSMLLTPEPKDTFHKKMAWECTQSILVPAGSIREKIRFFQNDEKNIKQKKILNHSRSNSCGCILERLQFIDQTKYAKEPNSNSLTSISNFMQDDNSLNSDLNSDIVQPISQEPFSDDSLSVSCGIIDVPISYNNDRVLTNKPDKHIKDLPSFYTDPVFEIMPEPFETNIMLSPSVPKIEISNFQNISSLSASEISTKLIPGYLDSLSRSSTNLCEGWKSTEMINQNHNQFISMTNITSEIKKEIFPDKKLINQSSTLESIPIKLRILQFNEKVRSKSWKDYILERTETGARFRKRLKSMRHDKANDFVIKADEVNRFAIESPHKRQKTGSGLEVQVTEFSNIKYELMTSDNHVHLKFFFNPSIFQDTQSSTQAHATYNEIIGVFKPGSLKRININDSQKSSLSEPHKSSIHISQSYGNFTTITETKVTNEEYCNLDLRCSPSTSISVRSTSKSSAENISNNAAVEPIPQSSKNIFKQAIDKIKPEKKVKSYEVFTGTKAEFEEFKKQLEGGILPMELDAIDENGSNFNKYIHEVPRMINKPRIPMIIYLCTEIVEKIGLQCEGIYRISGNQRVIRTLSSTLNKSLGEIDSTLTEWNNVHAVCGTLKLFLRKLKQNLIPADLSHVLAYSCKAVDSDDPISLSKTLMDIRYHLSSYQNSSRRKIENEITKNIEDQLDCRWQTLQYLLKHLARVVSYRRFNSMDEHALSVCFNPVVMESWQKSITDIKADNEIMIKALELILIHQDWLFNNWNPHIDGTRSTELMANAIDYAKKFIEKKYDISIKTNYPSEIEDKDVNINMLVLKIVNQATIDFAEKKRIGRRHSSHTPGQKSIHVKDETDTREKCFAHRNSNVTEALDLSTCFSILRQIDKVPTIDENKRIKVTYISSTDSLSGCDENNDSAAKVELRKSGSKKHQIDKSDDIPQTSVKHKSDEYLNNKDTFYSP